MANHGTCTVLSNNPTGYTLTFTSSTPNTNLIYDPNLDNDNDPSTGTIYTIPTQNNLPIAGTPGYSFSFSPSITTPKTGTLGAWLAVPPNDGVASPIMIADTNAISLNNGIDYYDYAFATAIAANTLAGEYENTVTFTLVGKVPIFLAEVVSNNSITTMQGLTGAHCSSANYDPFNNGINSNNTVVLTDTRNGQDYMVRKLADDRCWMINNLKLGSTTGATTLTPADTNITSSFNLIRVGNYNTDYYNFAVA